jgi:hypothetical protein
VIEPASIDLGTMRQGETRRISFTLRNETSESIEARSTLSDCGCTVVRVRDRVIPPRGATVLGAR